MSVFSTERPALPRSTGFLSLTGLGRQFRLAWRRHRAERMLETLPYDTLKDIGFPSSDMIGRDQAGR